MARVGIVICNYNKAQMVCECIQSVLEMKYTDYDLYVADNASTDDSVSQIKQRFFGKLTLVVNEENKGGSGGFNAGMREAMKHGYDYIWCLDNDVLVDENALGELVLFLDANPDCGMAGSKVDHMEAPDYVQQYGMSVDFKCFATVAKYLNHPEDGTLPDVVYSDAVAACSVLVSTKLIERIGLLPEDNFLYWDDTEWGMKCNLAGFKVASVGSSVVLHCMGAKREDVNTFPTYYAWRNWIDFFMRYTSQDDLYDMCLSFLTDLFDIQYCSLYNGVQNKGTTVMLAYDDALHGVRGKAGEGRILAMDRNTDKLRLLIEGKRKLVIIKNGHEGACNRLSSSIQELNSEIEIHIYEDCSQIDEGADALIEMCNYIFTMKEMKKDVFYVDTELNIYNPGSPDDELMLFNYPYARKQFIASQLPNFMDKTMEIRRLRPAYKG